MPIPSVPRRTFLEAAAAGGAALMAPSLFAHRSRSLLADSQVEVLLDEPIGTIAPELYGHFTENLGGVIYDGVWVGEGSKIPNIGGVRKALVDAMKVIRPSVIRWPGGCFADSYDWRDGVGPRDRRPRRTNVWSNDAGLKGQGNIPARIDPNAFGTTEFMHFCRLVGAEAYLAANLRALPAQQFFGWLEYCNSPAGSTSWADVRAAAGDRDPYRVRFWGIGNEAWGCGGDFTPEEYAMEYRRFGTWGIPEYEVPLAFIASGPNGGDLEWTRRFFNAMNDRGALDRVWGWALHHYASAGDAGADAVKYDDRGWYDLLSSADRMETLITAHWQAMGQVDRAHRVKLVVDEWGAWHSSAPIEDPSHLFESQSTIRDALVAGLTLDTFHRHAEKVAMANVAQLINCIHSLFFSHEGKFVVTPSYHVFAMYAGHQGAKSVRTIFSSPRVTWSGANNSPRSLWGLNGSASVRGNVVTLTATNASLTTPRESEIAVRGGTIRSVRATTLAASGMHDVNSFAQPDRIAPVTASVPGSGNTMVYAFPPASVTRLEITLAG